jgi:hypothetical protein
MAALGLACMVHPAKADLTAYWSFDVNFDEEIGTVPSTTKADWGGGTNALGPGKFSQAVISTPADSTVGYQQFDLVPSVMSHTAGTMELWVNPTGGVGGLEWLMGTSVGNIGSGLWDQGVHLYLNAGRVHASLQDAVFTRDWLEPGEPTDPDPAGLAVLDEDEWNHVALVWDPNIVSLFVNGNRVSTQARDTGNWLTGDPHFFFAGSNPPGARAFTGSLDDGAIWNEVRYSGATYTIPTGPAGGGEQTCQDILLQGGAMPQDLNKDCEINLLDFAIFQADWLRCFDPTNNSCDNTWIQLP